MPLTSSAAVCARTSVRNAARFRYSSRLAIHRQVHSDSRLYPCMKCLTALKLNADLTRHQRIHAELRPFYCMHCDRGFSETRNRNRQECAVHADERPYQCRQCGNSFGFDWNFIAHNTSRACQVKTNEKCCETVPAHRLMNNGEDANDDYSLYGTTTPFTAITVWNVASPSRKRNAW